MSTRNTPDGERSSGATVVVRASDIVMWNEPSATRLQREKSGAPACRIAVTLPDVQLSVDDYDRFEEAGVLVIEVPQSLATEPKSRIAAYLTDLLSEGERAMAEGADASAAEELEVEFGAGGADAAPPMSPDEEQEFLDAINDPANQLGSY